MGIFRKHLLIDLCGGHFLSFVLRDRSLIAVVIITLHGLLYKTLREEYLWDGNKTSNANILDSIIR